MAVASDSTPPAQAPPQGPAKGWARRGGALSLAQRFLTLREGSIIIVTLIAFLYFAFSTDKFLTSGSLKALLPYFAPFAIMAAGEVFVMINAEIDLSVGAVYLFTPFIFYKLNANVGLPLVPAMIGALIVAMLVGLFNGLVVSVVGISSFVTTFGTLFTLSGLTLIISHATQVTTPGTSVVKVGTFAQIFGGGTYSELFWAIGIAIILQLVLSFTRWGDLHGRRRREPRRRCRGRRADEARADPQLRDVRVLAGFVGIIEAVRAATTTPDPSGSNVILFQAISAAVIGGTLLQGGSGTVIGAFIGAIFLGILQDGLNIKGVSANYFYFYLGIAILIAMAFNTYVSRVRTGPGMADVQVPQERIVGPQTADDDVLRVEHVRKSFGPISALRDINLHLRKGEVLGLLGDNGAGKSTLIKILCGFHKADAGTMWLKGEPYAPKSVLDARQHGIDTVYQDLALVDQLPVYQNMFLFREKVHSPIPFLANHIMKKETRRALEETGINIPRIDVPVARLSGGQRQAIAVARTISGDADVILLDEPLAAMGAKEGALILDLIARLKAEGRVSIIMILHNYIHVFQACDRVSLIQDGVIAFDRPTAETSVEELNEIVVEEYRRARQAAMAEAARTARAESNAA